ncbi:MAG: 4Fe-4S binding protein [Chitinophagaceae bacterium]
MAIKITDECINCGACEPECPNNAIYEGGVEWAFSDGTTVKGYGYTYWMGSSWIQKNVTPLLKMIRIILYLISAQNVRVFMKNHNVPQFAR